MFTGCEGRMLAFCRNAPIVELGGDGWSSTGLTFGFCALPPVALDGFSRSITAAFSAFVLFRALAWVTLDGSFANLVSSSNNSFLFAFVGVFLSLPYE